MGQTSLKYRLPSSTRTRAHFLSVCLFVRTECCEVNTGRHHQASESFSREWNQTNMNKNRQFELLLCRTERWWCWSNLTRVSSWTREKYRRTRKKMKLCVQVCTHNMRHDRDDVVVQSDSDDVLSSGQDSEMKFSSMNGTRARERLVIWCLFARRSAENYVSLPLRIIGNWFIYSWVNWVNNTWNVLWQHCLLLESWFWVHVTLCSSVRVRPSWRVEMGIWSPLGASFSAVSRVGTCAQK